MNYIAEPLLTRGQFLDKKMQDARIDYKQPFDNLNCVICSIQLTNGITVCGHYTKDYTDMGADDITLAKAKEFAFADAVNHLSTIYEGMYHEQYVVPLLDPDFADHDPYGIDDDYDDDDDDDDEIYNCDEYDCRCCSEYETCTHKGEKAASDFIASMRYYNSDELGDRMSNVLNGFTTSEIDSKCKSFYLRGVRDVIESSKPCSDVDPLKKVYTLITNHFGGKDAKGD